MGANFLSLDVTFLGMGFPYLLILMSDSGLLGGLAGLASLLSGFSLVSNSSGLDSGSGTSSLFLGLGSGVGSLVSSGLLNSSLPPDELVRPKFPLEVVAVATVLIGDSLGNYSPLSGFLGFGDCLGLW